MTRGDLARLAGRQVVFVQQEVMKQAFERGVWTLMADEMCW